MWDKHNEGENNGVTLNGGCRDLAVLLRDYIDVKVTENVKESL